MTIGKRLKEERERLGLTQAALGEIGEFGSTTVKAWERGTAFPNALFLSDIADIGADVQYIVIGERRGQGLGESAVHQAVLDAIDLLSLAKKVDADQLARAVVKLCARQAPAGSTATVPVKIDQQISGSGHQITRSGDINNKGRKK